MELQSEKRFQNLTLEQIQALDKVLTEVIPIYGRGNFPTLQVRAKDIIRVVKERLVERDIRVKDIRLNGATASHVLVKDNGLGYEDLDIIFGVDLPRQEDFQVIKEVVLGSLRDLLPYGVNRRKITCLTMKEAYVQKMVKVFNDNDRWSLICLSNNRAKTVGLRFVSSLRRHFEFSVDSFQIILDRMLESYWESERRQSGQMTPAVKRAPKCEDEGKVQEKHVAPKVETDKREKNELISGQDDPGEGQTQAEVEAVEAGCENKQVSENANLHLSLQKEEATDMANIGDGNLERDNVFGFGKENVKGKCQFHKDDPFASSPKSLFEEDPLMTHSCISLQTNKEAVTASQPAEKPVKTISKEFDHHEDMSQIKADTVVERNTNTTSVSTNSHLEYTFPPPAKKSCSTLEIVPPDTCPSPKLQRKMSRKLITKQQLPEKWSVLTDLTTELFPPIEIPKPLQQSPALLDNAQKSSPATSEGSDNIPSVSAVEKDHRLTTHDLSVKPKQSKKPPDLQICAVDSQGLIDPQIVESSESSTDTSWSTGSSPGATTITVEAECMYGDFQQAMHHLQNHLIATRNPEEIRGGGLLKYSDLLVRNFHPASETEIKSLERYMCSRFFIDFPDVSEQQRKIEAYLQCHYIGSEEASKYDYLMTLRRVIDESTVCLMGHERRQTLNMITVLALRVLGEQNAIPNTANVTCFYQPAPYLTEPMYNSYFVSQTQPPLMYHPYPLHVHLQTGLV